MENTMRNTGNQTETRERTKGKDKEKENENENMRRDKEDKVEYVFNIVKDIFHFRKTSYRGLMKLEARAFMLKPTWNFESCLG